MRVTIIHVLAHTFAYIHVHIHMYMLSHVHAHAYAHRCFENAYVHVWSPTLTCTFGHQRLRARLVTNAYVHVWSPTLTCTFVNTRTHARTNTQIYTLSQEGGPYTRTHTHAHKCTQLYTLSTGRWSLCIYIHTQIYTNIYIVHRKVVPMYIYTHTNIHKYIHCPQEGGPSRDSKLSQWAHDLRKKIKQVNIDMHAHLKVCLCAPIYVCRSCLSIQTYMNMLFYKHIYIYIYIHTYITHSQNWPTTYF
jgi:hypothetical protein